MFGSNNKSGFGSSSFGNSGFGNTNSGGGGLFGNTNTNSQSNSLFGNTSNSGTTGNFNCQNLDNFWAAFPHIFRRVKKFRVVPNRKKLSDFLFFRELIWNLSIFCKQMISQNPFLKRDFSGSMFGNSNNQSSFSFGGNNQNSNSGGLFGNSNNTSTGGGLFGGNFC